MPSLMASLLSDKACKSVGNHYNPVVPMACSFSGNDSEIAIRVEEQSSGWELMDISRRLTIVAKVDTKKLQAESLKIFNVEVSLDFEKLPICSGRRSSLYTWSPIIFIVVSGRLAY